MRTLIVSLLGARMNYAVPRILHEAGILDRLFSDFCSTKGVISYLRAIPQRIRPILLRRMLGRTPQGLPSNKVTAFNRFGLEYAWRVRNAKTEDETMQCFLWGGRELCRRVNQSEWGEASGVFTFNTAGLETLELAKQRGLLAVMEQSSSPAEIDHQLVSQERRLHPEWEGPLERPAGLQQYAAREKYEWALADRIICGSEFVRQNIKRAGGPAEKCVVAPYGVDLPMEALAAREMRVLQGSQSSRTEPLKVLSIGRVELRKGICSVLEAARLLGSSVRFRWVGSNHVRPETLDILRKHVCLLNAVPRTEIWEHYRWADVFLLPSICEGSATVTYEALAMGLPVVCTPNAGSVVRDGIDGLLVPVRDSNAIVKALETLCRDRGLLRCMSEAALHRSDLTVSAYAQRLLCELGTLGMATKQAAPLNCITGA